MKLIKLFYRIEDNIDYNCLDKCPFNEALMCGSGGCIKCKHCIWSGTMPVWNLNMKRGLIFDQGYVVCEKCYTETSLKMKIMKFIHRIKNIFS